MANWNLPSLTDLYSNFLTYLTGRLNDAVMWLDSDATTPTNLPTGAKRWNNTNSNWQEWNGSTWVNLATTYGISVSGNAATATNADTLDGSHASAFATAAQGTKADAALPSASYTASDVLTKIKTVDGTGSGLDADKLNGLNSTDIFNIACPSGTVIAHAGTNSIAGWFECNGAAINRSIYYELFAVIGTTYGVGDGSTTFNLPDLRGEFIRGWDHSKGVDSGRTIGSSQTDQFQGHYHNIGVSADNDFVGYTSGGGGPGYAAGYGGSTPKARTPITDGTNGTPRRGAETRPRNIAMRYLIKY